MNSAKVKSFAPSGEAVVELVSLAQFSPKLACQRLRALLLVKPDYVGDLQSSTFKAALNIHDDTTYENLTLAGYDPLSQQLGAVVVIKQSSGYSDNALNNGSEEFVRFYLSYDGGSKWLDQGMRVINVFDADSSKSRNFEVKMQIVPVQELLSSEISPRVRAILSWKIPPPARAPEWRPLWGNVVESSFRMQDTRVIFSGRLQSLAYVELRSTPQHAPVNRKNVLKGRNGAPLEAGPSMARAQSRQLPGTLVPGAGIVRGMFRALRSLVKGGSVGPNC